MTHPIDGYRDVYPYPWRWSRDFAGPVRDWLDVLDSTYELIDPWTYHAHWTTTDDPADPRWPWVVDLFWLGQPYVRSQLPPDEGDDLSDFIVQNMPFHIRCLIWNHMIWTPEGDWSMWTGEQGDFVDHIHIEFDSEALTNPSG